jgi:uncharacterized membrane protein (DUF106 family)
MWYDVFVSWLNPVLYPLVNIDPLVALLVLSFVVALCNKLAYWKFTDQSLIREYKAQLKKFQEQLKKAKDDTKKMLEIQSKMMDINMQLMSQQFKPLLITMLPVIIIFGWMSLHLAYDPLQPGEPFVTQIELAQAKQISAYSQTAELISDRNLIGEKVQFSWNASKGNHTLVYSVSDGTRVHNVSHVVLVDSVDYLNPLQFVSDSDVKAIRVHNPSKVVFSVFGLDFTWFWSYVLFSIIFSLAIHRLMKLA